MCKPNGSAGQHEHLRDFPHIYWLGGYWRVRAARMQYWKRPNQADIWARWIAAHAYVAWMNKQPNVKPIDKAELSKLQSRLTNPKGIS